MLFNSIEYFVFIHLFVLAYWGTNKNIKVQNVLLLAGSYFFYGLWDFRFLGLILISSVVDYFTGLGIHSAASQRKRKMFLVISLFVNLGILFVFKYYNFFVDSFSMLLQSLGLSANSSSLQLILPVGISFYTFQTLSYTIDIYRGKLEPTKDIIGFFTFVAFFPQLVAGPIERASNLLPQILKSRVFDTSMFKDGMRQILWGLFKKVVVADNCAYFVDFIFANYDGMDGWVLWVGVVLFAFQIYCDFSGYSDIAIGSAKMLGIQLMQNFSTPYFSRNIAEFWRRWHISLSTWFKDYVYIPLGGSRVSKPRQVLNIMVTFTVSGLWHGANWTFFVWGLLHACYYLPHILFRGKPGLKEDSSSIMRPFVDMGKVLLTFLFVCIAWVFFRAEDISHAIYYLSGMLDFSLSTNNEFVNRLYNAGERMQRFRLGQFWFLICVIILMMVVEWLNRKYTHGLQRLHTMFIVRLLFYLSLAFLIVEFMIGNAPFIYFQF